MSFEQDNHIQFKNGQNLMKKAQKLISSRRWSKARDILFQAQKIFEYTQSSLTEAQALDLIALTFEHQQNWEQSLQFYHHSLSKYKIAGNPITLAKTHNKLALVYYELSNFEDAHENAQIAIDLLENVEHPITKAEAFHTQAQIYMKQLDYSSALFYENFALENSNKQFSWNIALDIYENLAFLHHHLSNFAQSNEFCQKSLAMEQKQKNYVVISKILELRALNFQELYLKDQSIANIKDALSIQTQIEFQEPNKPLYLIKLNYAKILLQFQELTEFERICDDLIEFAELNNDTALLLEGLHLMIKFLITTPSHEEYQSIEDYLKEAVILAKNQPDKEMLSEIQINYGKFYDQNGNIGQAEDSFQQAIQTALNSSLNFRIGSAYEQFGLYYHAHKKIELAHTNFELSISYFTKSSHRAELAEAYYNFACTNSLLHMGKETIANLTQAINLNPKYKQIAAEDDDFSAISKEDLFLDLIK